MSAHFEGPLLLLGHHPFLTPCPGRRWPHDQDQPALLPIFFIFFLQQTYKVLRHEAQRRHSVRPYITFFELIIPYLSGIKRPIWRAQGDRLADCQGAS